MTFRNKHPVLSGTLGALLTLMQTSSALAADDYVVYSPRVKQGETEVELRGFNTRDANPDINQTGMFGAAIAYSPTSWWKTELYNGPFVYGPSIAGTNYSGWEWENFFQLAPHDTYWADVGFLLAYVRNNQVGVANSLELGPLLEKETEATLQRLNLIWEKQVGVDMVGKFNFRATYMAGYKLEDAFVPGIEAYYRPADNAHQLGPGFSGEIHVGHEKNLEYSSALLYGLNQGAPARTFVFRVSSVF
ncbi:MAG: hypothetical protein G3I10_11535 [Ferrovum sp.]|nr:hypothetical protein [Ferrovum sp.]